MDEDGSVRQAERREFARSDCLEQLVAGALPQKRQGASVSRDHLLVLDPRGPKRLLDAPAGVKPRSSVIAVADKERGFAKALTSNGFGARLAPPPQTSGYAGGIAR
jgi:hypothetical protein